MSAPEKIYAVIGYIGSRVRGEFSSEQSDCNRPFTEYTRRDISQASVAAALEAAASKAAEEVAAHGCGEISFFVRRAIRALITQPQHDALAAHVAKSRAVKPLIWEDREGGRMSDAMNGMGGLYRARRNHNLAGDHQTEFCHQILPDQPFLESLAAAKAFAQKDHEARALAQIGGAA